jgi:hypothetical protein
MAAPLWQEHLIAIPRGTGWPTTLSQRRRWTADNPERLITPGVFNPAVTQATIKTTICVP